MNTGADHTGDYKVLSVITKAMIAGILLFTTVAIVIHFLQDASIQDKNLNNKVFAIVLLIAVVIILVARIVYTKRINILRETNQSNREKLDVFRVITITHMALCEVPAILSIILFICFGNFLLFLAVAIALIEMIKKFPTQQRIESAVNSGTF
jgi:nitrate/nitrite transporter NarK